MAEPITPQAPNGPSKTRKPTPKVPSASKTKRRSLLSTTTNASKGGCSFENILTGKQQNYCCDMIIKQEGSVTDRVSKLTKKIEDIIRALQIEDNIVESFFIGKTYVPKSKKAKKFDPMKPGTWRKEGISQRWYSTYIPMEYDALIVLTVVTKDDVPDHTNQEDYTIMLEQKLLHYYKIENYDERIQNDSFSGGRKTTGGYIGYALYMAVKFEYEEVIEEMVPKDNNDLKEEDEGLTTEIKKLQI
uniref:Uncharacterized protein n=1 Tax=Amphimedon queenslandica TaxID=400682 RepID=A0A1X7TZM3_AMPQE